MTPDLAPWQQQELTGGGDSRLHFHLADRGPFPIPCGSFYDTTTQTCANTTTAYPVLLNTTNHGRGASLQNSSQVRVSATGVYDIQFSLQLTNNDVQEHDAEIWLRKNGTDVPYSNTVVGVGPTHGGVNGHEAAAWNFFEVLQAGDYIELVWRVSNTAITMPTIAAGVTPARPAVPSVILTINLVSI